MGLIRITNAESDLFIEGVFYSTLFHCEIGINIDPDVDMEYAEMCAEHFNSLSDRMIDEFCDMAVRYCEFMHEEWADFGYDDIVEEINTAIPEKVEGREILKFISSPTMYVMPPEQNVPGYSIECNCIWEPEHGLDWIIRDDKNLYVGQSEALGAWLDDDAYEGVF